MDLLAYIGVCIAFAIAALALGFRIGYLRGWDNARQKFQPVFGQMMGDLYPPRERVKGVWEGEWADPPKDPHEET